MRRRGKRYTGIAGSGLLLLLVVLLAVFCGYAGTKYVIAPYLLGEQKQEEPENRVEPKSTKSDEKVVSGKQNVQKLTTTQGVSVVTSTAVHVAVPVTAKPTGSALYCIQFGSFSTKAGAEVRARDLTDKNIASFVMERDGAFKVLGIPYEGEAKAKAAATAIKAVETDVYVVPM